MQIAYLLYDRFTALDITGPQRGERVARHGKVVTAAVVSAGIDMALQLVAWMRGPEAAKAIQLGIEYDPQPPFDSGSPEKAPAATVESVTAAFGAAEKQVLAGG